MFCAQAPTVLGLNMSKHVSNPGSIIKKFNPNTMHDCVSGQPDPSGHALNAAYDNTMPGDGITHGVTKHNPARQDSVRTGHASAAAYC